MNRRIRYTCTLHGETQPVVHCAKCIEENDLLRAKVEAAEKRNAFDCGQCYRCSVGRVTAEEREACAKIAADYPVSAELGQRIAAAIRARGNQSCGHPLTAIAGSDEGTNYCRRCEAEWAD